MRRVIGLLLLVLFHRVGCFEISGVRIEKRSNVLRASIMTEETYSQRIEQSLKRKYGTDEMSRVLSSWRDLVAGEKYEAVLGDHPLMKQEARSYLPGLTVRPFWSVENLEWAKKLAEDWQIVRNEFDTIALADGGSSLKKRGNNVWAVAIDDEASAYGQDWRTLVLMDRGRWDPINAALFPQTCRLIDNSGIPAVEAFFAAMKPKTIIKPHSDTCNFVLTSHLGLVIPGQDESHPPCRLSVGDQTRPWREGQVSLFDTSLLHDAVNDSNQYRYILMFRVWHPDLTSNERKGLQFLFDCLEEPGLVSDQPMEILDAEARVAAQRASLDSLLPLEKEHNLTPTKEERRSRGGFASFVDKKGKSKKKRK
uniref:Aspartyl/asparaginy/proline hydroxylase domain-containing protein n=1 Tax=Aureoumbra lagunensis TaxID=44058 RepID=A0A6S8DPY6_9STRA